MLKIGFIADPSVISKPSGLETVQFLREEYSTNKIILPTSLYTALKEDDRRETLLLLKKWSWRLRTEDIKKWLESNQFAEEAPSILRVSSPASEFWRLEKDPTIVEEIAEEIREVSMKLRVPLVAISESFKHWLIRKDVTILEVANEDYRKFKKSLRRQYENSLKKRLLIRGIQAGLASPLLLSIIVGLQPGALPPQLSSLLSSSGSAAMTAMYQAIVVDP